ncbi:MAG: hypothetical protein GTN81_06670 [Proteobacteria bacterium]|nr:hypothetical protein [Pseudomonadota bacterium]
MDIPLDFKTLALLVAILFFLISLLLNLLQRRYHKKRIHRLLNHGESQSNFLAGLDASLGKLESACTFEMDGARSPQDIGKSIHITRNQIKSSIADIETHLRSFREYRRKEKANKRHMKRLEKMRKRRTGRAV